MISISTCGRRARPRRDYYILYFIVYITTLLYYCTILLYYYYILLRFDGDDFDYDSEFGVWEENYDNLLLYMLLYYWDSIYNRVSEYRRRIRPRRDYEILLDYSTCTAFSPLTSPPHLASPTPPTYPALVYYYTSTIILDFHYSTTLLPVL